MGRFNETASLAGESKMMGRTKVGQLTRVATASVTMSRSRVDSAALLLH